MRFRFCDDVGADGFGWIADDAATRTSHALAADGRVWLVDPLDWPDATDRAAALGEPAGVIQLLDRHNRDCAALAGRLGVTRFVVPDEVAGSPFRCIPVKRWKRWRESALWWPQAATLVVADALGTNRFFTVGRTALGVHPLLRLTPPNVFGAFEPKRVLVGHGEGIEGPGAVDALRQALESSRRGLPVFLARLPFAARR